jgi:ribonuclease J
VHSGDFKLDPTPGVGEPWTPRRFAAIGPKAGQGADLRFDQRLLHHPGRSESTLHRPLDRVIAGARGMVVATTFASNVARVKTLAEAGRAAGRSVCLLGRAMRDGVGGAGNRHADRLSPHHQPRGCPDRCRART